MGIKDAWITPEISAAEVTDYYHKAFEDSVTLREVDFSYFQTIVEHFLAITVEKSDIPNLHFLEILEFLGIRLKPDKLDLDCVFEQLSVQIIPFTQEKIAESLKRSKMWLKNKQFTESWYIENPTIDKIVNHNSSFVEGVKVCRLADAIDAVFSEEMELHRDKWQFHFLWIALWVKAKHKKMKRFGRIVFNSLCYSSRIPIERYSSNERDMLSNSCQQHRNHAGKKNTLEPGMNRKMFRNYSC